MEITFKSYYIQIRSKNIYKKNNSKLKKKFKIFRNMVQPIIMQAKAIRQFA
jgi:hypothetical protein